MPIELASRNPIKTGLRLEPILTIFANRTIRLSIYSSTPLDRQHMLTIGNWSR